MVRFGWLAGAVVATAAAALWLWATSMPLGLPGEWTWPRLPADAQSGWNILLAEMAAGLYLVFIILGSQRLANPRLRHREAAAWLTGLAVASLGWLWSVQETAPSAGQLAKTPFILYYPSSSGYFYKARFESPRIGPFLAGYEDLMRQGDVLHVGTHPPGLFVVFHGLTALVQRWPMLGDAAWFLAPMSVREATAVVMDNTRMSGHPLSPADAQVLWLAMLLAMALTAATVAPLYGLLRLQLPRDAAFSGAALWPAVPAAAVFLPKSDAAFPFLSALLAWLVLTAWRRESRIRAALAGGVLFFGLFCSLAFLPVALWLSLVVGSDAVRRMRSQESQTGRVLLWVACGMAGFLVPVLLLAIACDLPLHRIWWWNYRNHAGFYAEYPRTYWKWLFVNPVELALAAGAPLMTFALAGLRHISRGAQADGIGRLAAWWGVAVWALLWLTGKNSGEAARLWLLFMPGLVWMAAVGASSLFGPSQGDTRWNVRGVWACLLLQLAACVLTVHRVGGFHFEAP